MRPAALADALQVARGRHDDAARAHDRLGDKSGHALRADLAHLGIELLDQGVAEGVERLSVRPPIGIGR